MCINKIPFLQVVEELKLEIKPLRLFRLAAHSTHNDAKSFVKLEMRQVKTHCFYPKDEQFLMKFF